MVAPTTIDTRIVNALGEIPRIARMVEALGADHHLPSDVVYDLQLALEEILTNVITHGYPDDQVHHISIRLTLDAGLVTAEIQDDGRPFNPLDAPRPDLRTSLKDRPVGGLGILFVRTLMDEVEYERAENLNRLVLRKRTAQ